ncbi:MAG TPA: hydroxyisourate hydrolase [Opitutus sp.]|nr:hydroxyisourate hydrolase [Opitutus sp.]
MPAKLSTHVLDLTSGRPAEGIKIDLWRRDGSSSPARLKHVATNRDGRIDAPLLEGAELKAGSYELVFHVREYFAAHGVDGGFLDEVPIRFNVTDATASYHVPLLVTPWSYSTYRGS